VRRDLFALAIGGDDDQVLEPVEAGQVGRIAEPVTLLREMQTPEADYHAARKTERLPQPVDAEDDQSEAERRGREDRGPDGCGDNQPDGCCRQDLEDALRSKQACPRLAGICQL